MIARPVLIAGMRGYSHLKILMLGHMTPGSNSRSLSDGFVQAGHEVRSVDTAFAASPRVGTRLWMSKRWRREVTKKADRSLHLALKEAQEGFRPDLLVAIKTVMFDQELILGSGARRKLHVSFDDVSNADNISRRYLANESKWDAVVTTKSHNVAELTARGVRQVISIKGAYDPTFHRISVPFRARRYTAGFIGAARPDRFHLPLALAAEFPDSGVIYGPRWDRKYPNGVPGTSIFPPVTVDGFTKAANSIQMGIVLLNSENRDTHTMRSYETPACGQLILGQRTGEHCEMFEDGTEALFFDSWEEMWSLARAASTDLSRMEQIAAAGQRRVVSGRNTYRHRAQEIVEAIS